MKCLKKKKLKNISSVNIWKITFEAAPSLTILYICITIVNAIISTIVSTFAVAYFVDYAQEIINGKGNQEKIFFPFAVMLFVLMFSNLVGPTTNLMKNKLVLQIKKYCRIFLLKKQAMLEYYNIENKETYELISRVTGNPEYHFVEGFDSYMIVITIIIYVLSILGIIVTHAWGAAVFIVFFSTPMVIMSLLSGKKNYQASCETEKYQRQVDYLEEVLSDRSAIDERTMFGYSDYLTGKWWEIYQVARSLKLKVQARYMLLTKSSTMGLSLITIFVAITLLPSIISGKMTPGMYMGLIGTVLSVTHQMGWNMSAAVEAIANSKEYVREFNVFLELASNDEYLAEPSQRDMNFRTLEFKEVSFKYPNTEEYVLKNLSFKIVNGRKYAFVGANGAGKTTITKLLMGLYTNYEGEILINNVELREYPKSTLKSMITSIQQDFAKYAISLKDNIVIGDLSREYKMDEINIALSKAGLTEVVGQLDGNLDNYLGKINREGYELSTGQWQRIAVARAIFSNAPIKILDEPTAALDPISEGNIYNEFERLMMGKTAIFISHRLGSTKIIDEIFVLKDGEIAEKGNHNDLMKLKGLYYNMFEAQRKWYQ